MKNNMSRYKEGTILFVKEIFDAYSTKLSIESISTCKDDNFIESYGGDEGRWQRAFVVNCFDMITWEGFTNEFVFNKKEVKPGDKVYVVITNDDDPYGDKIIGVFTEEPNKETFYQEYVKHWNSVFTDEYDQIDDDWAYVSEIIEMVVE